MGRLCNDVFSVAQSFDRLSSASRAQSGRFLAFAAVVNELDAGFDLEIGVLFELGLRSAGSRGG
jgi:hypothetical protein